MESSHKELILGPMRLPFLVLAPVCVLLGQATAIQAGASFNLFHLLLALLGALAAHVAVNALNEYDDFRSGLDLKTKPTPFSGGSGTLPRNPDKEHYALGTGLIALAVTIGLGIYFCITVGWLLLPVGLLGVIVIVTYTRWLTHSPFLCLIAPGLGFGTFMMLGTHFVLAGSYSWTAAVASMIPFFLVSNLLLLNQFPDIEADREVDRKHLIISSGLERGVQIYGLFLVLAYVTVIVAVLLDLFPMWGLLAFITLPLAVMTFQGARRYAADIPKLVPYLGKNVLVVLLMPVLLAVGLLIAG